MSTCPNCGRVESDNAVFCESCGTMLKAAPANNAPLEPPLITMLRGIGGSGLMLTLAILYTISTAYSLFTSFANIAGGSFSLPIFEIIFCISIWSVYGTCKRPVGMLISTGGITAIRTVKIIQLVLVVIAAVLVLAAVSLMLFVFGVSVTEATYNIGISDSALIAIFTIIMAAAAAFMVLDIIITVFAVRFYGSVRDSLKSGFPYCRSALPYGIFTMIGGIITVISSVMQIAFLPSINEFKLLMIDVLSDIVASSDIDIRLDGNMLYSMMPSDISSVITAALGAVGGVCLIIVAVLVFRYRNAVKQ